MLVFSDQNLAFLAVPKTGTTAIEMALKPRADVIFSKHRKHMPAAKYRNKILPFLDGTLGVRPAAFAVMRDPIEQIRSWFRYRSAPRLNGSAKSTNGCSFDDFVLEVIKKDHAPFAGIGSQFSFLCSGVGAPLVDHIFAYEKQPKLIAFLEDAFNAPMNLQQRNVSPPVKAPLSPEVEERLRIVRAQEFALYDSIVAADGHLITPQ